MYRQVLNSDVLVKRAGILAFRLVLEMPPHAVASALGRAGKLDLGNLGVIGIIDDKRGVALRLHPLARNTSHRCLGFEGDLLVLAAHQVRAGGGL